jgi:uncharacterized Zn finger protein
MMQKAVPASVETHCPECKGETLHRTVKGRFAGRKKLHMVLRCSGCDCVHEEIFELVGRVPVRTIVSRGKESERVSMDMSTDWSVAVGDELMHEDERLMVTGIEVDGRRVATALAKEIQTLWTKNFETVDVNVSINRRGRTLALRITVNPDEEFEVGSEIEVDGRPVIIHSIKTESRKMRKGTAIAREIVRVYCTEKGRQRR